ncbi:two-component regulator propeller domain-containing protein [Chryseobacterium wanjuense]
MQKNILFIFFIVVFFTVRSQKLSIQFFNTDNGLPQNSVKDIIKDKYGFIWMTTENGIVRYDGTNFLVYKNFPLTSQRFTYFYGHPEKDSIYTTGDYGKTILLHDKLPKVTKIAKNTLFLIKDNSGHLLYCSNYTSGATAGVKYFMNFKEGRYYLTETGLGYVHFGSKKKKFYPSSLFLTTLHKFLRLMKSSFTEIFNLKKW